MLATPLLTAPSHLKKRMRQLQKRVRSGSVDVDRDDPFDLFLAATSIRYCYYSETHKILGSTYGMCVLQVGRTPSHLHTLTPSHTLTHPLYGAPSHSHTLTPPHPHRPSHTLSMVHPHTLTPSHLHARTDPSHPHTSTPAQTLTHPLYGAPAHSHTLTPPHPHTPSHTLSMVHPHTLTLSHLHTLTLS